MYNDFNARGDKPREGGRDRLRQTPRDQQKLTDREVPLGLSRTPAAIHAWLDGDAPEASVRQGETVRHVEFWNALSAEVAVRRDMRTPTGLQEAIMAALPATTPRVITPWWSRPMEMSPAALATAAAGLLALGAAIGATITAR